MNVSTNDENSRPGIRDEDWPTDPDGIARLIQRMDRLEPFDIPVEGDAELQAWREKVKQLTLANQDSGVEGIFD